jgi:hypothetical protein
VAATTVSFRLSMTVIMQNSPADEPLTERNRM